MAGVKGSAVSQFIAYTTATRTIWRLKAPVTVRVRLKSIRLSFFAVTPTDKPVRCQLYLCNDRTSGVAVSSITPTKWQPELAEVIASTADQDFSTEPDNNGVIVEDGIHPQLGELWEFPDGDEIYIRQATAMCVRVVTPNEAGQISVSCRFEE